MSNMYGIMCAKHHKFPESKKEGILKLKPLTVFYSDNVSRFDYERPASKLLKNFFIRLTTPPLSLQFGWVSALMQFAR